MKAMDEFVKFLETSYRGARSGRPLSKRVARDQLSRCLRIERVLGIQLNRQSVSSAKAFEKLVADIKGKREELASPARRYAYVDYICAVRRYREFVSQPDLRTTA